MRKLLFFGVLLFTAVIVFLSTFRSSNSFSDVFLENVEALSGSENPDTDPDCFGTGSVDCSKWYLDQVITVKVERKSSGDIKSRRLPFFNF